MKSWTRNKSPHRRARQAPGNAPTVQVAERANPPYRLLPPANAGLINSRSDSDLGHWPPNAELQPRRRLPPRLDFDFRAAVGCKLRLGSFARVPPRKNIALGSRPLCTQSYGAVS